MVSWKEWLDIGAGRKDFFTTEVWTATGLSTFYVLFFLQLQTRKVILGGLTPFPKEAWLKHLPVSAVKVQ